MMLSKFRAAWRRRALPTSIRALKSCQASYSQFGEDLIANTIFGPGYAKGRYVDVGCFDPLKWSNTYRFYLKGWCGICIDPNADYAAAWQQQRPRDRFLTLAVSAQSGSANYLKHRQLPTDNHLAVEGDVPDEVISLLVVETKPLVEILDEHHPLGAVIDLLSVDCEGHDLVVLQSNDFDRFRPRVLIVEDLNRSARSEIDEFCESLDYKFVALSAFSKVFADMRWLD